MRDVLNNYLAAAEAEGRTLSDAEAKLIETLASAPEVPAGYVEVPREMLDIPAALPRVQASEPDRPGEITGMLDAIHNRTPFVSATVADYKTSMTVGVDTPVTGRLLDWLYRRGALGLGGASRTYQVPKIASGDAAGWTFPSEKSEIVTELASIPSTVHAAYTSMTSTSALDIEGLEMIISGLLSRRVIAVENKASAEGIAAQGVQQDASDAADAISKAIIAASAIDVTSVVAMLAPDVAAKVTATGLVGALGDSDRFQNMVMGVPYAVVQGLTPGTAVAVDTRATAVSFTPVMTLVDPYSEAKSNVVTIRVETSTAVVVSDPTAVGVAKVSATSK